MAIVLAAASVLLVWGVMWGLPATPESWAPDEIRPFVVREGLAQAFSGGWVQTYPPFHFYTLALLHLPTLGLESAGHFDLRRPDDYNAMFVAYRAVSIVLALGLLLLVYRCARLLVSRGASVAAAAIVALMPPFVFYGKLANVDVPYLFWFMLATLFFLRAYARDRHRDYLFWGIAAALAVGTKDQAAGLLLPMPIALAIRSYRVRRATDRGAAPWRILTRLPIWRGCAAGAVAFLLIDNVIWNWSGLVTRLQMIRSPMVQHADRYGFHVSRQIYLITHAGYQLLWLLGWPGLIATFAGVATILARPRGNRRVLLLLWPLLTYWLVFIAPLGFYVDRFFMPVAILLTIIAGEGAVAIFRWLSRLTVRPVVLAVFGTALLYLTATAASVDWLMTHDSRPVVDTWAVDHLSPTDRILGLGPAMYFPRLRPFPNQRYVVSPRWTDLSDDVTVVMITSAADMSRYEHDQEAQTVVLWVQSGRTAFRHAFSYQTRPPIALLDYREVLTNLDKINPQIDIFVRTRASAPAGQ